MKKLKIISQSPITQRSGLTKYEEIIELNDIKFRIRYENSNGDPMGFNYKMCLSAFSKSEIKWNNLDDISVLDMTRKIPNYFSVTESKLHCKEFTTKMKDRILKIYS